MAPDSNPALPAEAAGRVAAALAITAGLVVLAGYNYLFFHSVVEVAGIAVAFAIFLLVWNTRQTLPDAFFLLVGISFLFVGALDLVHALAYKGMGIIPGDGADLATQLWLAARYFQSVTLLAAALLIGRAMVTGDRDRDAAVFGIACAAGTGLLLASIFAWGTFPAAFVEGSGLTPFKVASEYVISLVMLATIAVLVRKRDRFDPSVFRYLVAAEVLLIAGELAFSSYASVYGPANLLGHLFRLASVYCFYRAFVVVGLTRPTDLLFRELTTREAALRRSEQRYRSLVECAPDAIFVNRDDRVDYVNPAALSLFGAAAPGEIVGRPALDLFHPEYRGLVSDRIRKLREGSPVPLVHERIVRLDGSVRDVEVAAFPFEDDAGPAIEVILRDVTDRKAAERRTAEYAERLAASNEDLERFAYVASHDLQEPLRSIVGFSQLLERRYRGQLDQDADEFIGFIIEGGQRMQALIQDLLAFSRVTTGARPFERVEMASVFDDVVAELDGPIREAGASVAREVLPAVTGDRTQVRQVLANLVGNAVKYRRAGVRPEVSVSARPVDGMVEFAVRDNGIGIEEQYFDRIFEMFRRLHTHDEVEGTGIGLAVVKRIVERHGGRVRVESTPGEGSTFFFTLPAA
jgi:PAS domain S-box-containing protein